MPEYLSPGVYVEEIDVGVRPIEGVSTSTAGMVGVAERGPVDVPILVTGFAEYQRLFGGYLDDDEKPDAWYLPHAVEGFFKNGGKRLWVTRVVADQAPPNQATVAETALADRGELSAFAGSTLAVGAHPTDSVLLAESTAGLANGEQVRVGDGSTAEYVDLAAAGAVLPAGDRTRALRLPLAATWPAATAVTVVPINDANPPEDLTVDVPAGAVTLELVAAIAGLAADDLVRIGTGAADVNREYAVVDAVNGAQVTLRQPLRRARVAGTDQVAEVTEGVAGAARQLAQTARAGEGLVFVDAAGGPASGNVVRLGANLADPTREYALLADLHTVRLSHPAYAPHAAGTVVRVVALAPPLGAADALDDDAPAGSRTLALVGGGGPFAAGNIVSIDAGGANPEWVTVDQAVGTTLTLRQALARDRAAGDSVEVVTRGPGATTTLVEGLGLGGQRVFLSTAAGFGAGVFVEIGDPADPGVEYHRLAAAPIGELVLADALEHAHDAGTALVRRDDLLEVFALDPGEWGNELRVVVEDEREPLLSTTVTAGLTTALPITLATANGVEPGTILDFGGALAKVATRTGNTVTVATAGPPFAVNPGDPVVTRDFQLRIDWVKPGRLRPVASETFRRLSLDPRHSRYLVTVLGDVAGPIRPWDRRPQGQSDLLRAADLRPAAVAEAQIRLGPDVLFDLSPSGQLRAAGRPLAGGGDPVAGILDATYIGVDDVDPLLRTGLYSLRNERSISLVSIPGRTSEVVQRAVIDHCELARYRFAVLDSEVGATLTDVRNQRNQFETRYAALYYPWVMIPDPFPINPANAGEIAVPPAGHVLGVYARTDQQRGVHKAPANELLRNLVDLERKINQSEQDLLNPSPTNISVLRDFTEEGRGLRVWGARCITSDTDWKYVNVRRLFIFLEQSLDQGTQWVVFEPNDEPLWARVVQSISQFLTRVWRDGALQGTTPEEAFFVRCDRSTMTQDDIDNGRLIVMVGVAPVKPAEFVIIRIFQSTLAALSE